MTRADLPLPHAILLLALRDDVGTSVVDTASLDTALAGAMLAEPASDSRIGLVSGRVAVVDGTRSSDPWTDLVVRRIAAEPKSHRPRWWLTNLAARELRDRVADELVRSGTLERREARLLGVFPVVRYPEADADPEQRLVERLRGVLRGDPTDARTRSLLAIAAASGLLTVTFDEVPRRVIRDLVAEDWIAEAVRELIVARQAALATAT